MKTPWAVILCKFTDGTDVPFPKQYYDDLFPAQGTSSWNMTRYFGDWSHGKIDVSGSKVFGWFQLSKSVNDYNSLGGAARPALMQWARNAAIASGIDLAPFYGVIVCTNRWKDIGSTPGGVIAQGLTPYPQLLAHEMGHAYGLMHSRLDGSDDDYQDPWDIMSAANVYSAPDPHFSVIGPGLSVSNMRSRGWLDESRVWKSDPSSQGFDETLVLRPLVRRDLPGFLAAELPDGHFVEFRVRKGWDGGIPRPAVLVHHFEGGHSYLTPANSGSRDLIAGDSFGSDEDEQHDDFALAGSRTFIRVNVLDIDPAADKATVRLRYSSANRDVPVAMDPMAAILHGNAYVIWVETHHPHIPRVADVRNVLATLGEHDRALVLSRARTVARYANAVERAFATPDGAREHE